MSCTTITTSSSPSWVSRRRPRPGPFAGTAVGSGRVGSRPPRTFPLPSLRRRGGAGGAAFSAGKEEEEQQQQQGGGGRGPRTGGR